MNKKNWKRILCFSLAALMVLSLVTVLAPTARAGFGDFDSRSDFGSSHSSSSSGGSSSSSDSDGISFYFLIRAATSLFRLMGIENPWVSLAIIAVIVIAIRIFLNSRKKKQGLDHKDQRNPASLETLAAEDPAFNAADLTQRVRVLYEKMQVCWEEGNIEPLRKDFMPDTWTRFDTQLRNKNAAGETAHVRNIVYDSVDLLSYSKDAEHQVLKVGLTVTHNIWTTNAEGKCIQGTESTRKRFEYILTLMRPAGAVTGAGASEDTAHCPNCGAEIDLEAFAECPFCHTPVTKISSDWVISEIDALSQTTLQG